MSAASCRRPVRLEAIRCSIDAVGMGTPSSSKVVDCSIASGKRTVHAIKAGHALSYADAFAAALARSLNAVLITGDPEFRSVESLVRVEWL